MKPVEEWRQLRFYYSITLLICIYASHTLCPKIKALKLGYG